MNSALRQLDGKEDGDASTDDGARNHTHDVSFGDVVGSVSDVQAVLVIPDDGTGHRNGRAKHRGTDQAKQNGVLSVKSEKVLGVEEHPEQHQENDEGRT